MTEEEAKTKQCCGPQIIAMMIGLSAPNLEAEVVGSGVVGSCIGSACMAWRLREPEIERRQTGLGRMPVEPYERYVREGWRQIERPPGEDGLFYERTIAEGGGYCGLAGSPQ